ncbi:Membrane progestin receptor gamma [Galemys pyrenaicus]|uniref:Membrane progestin receptor gamma n=1 Tax=Galemys pyrenaicus TaxID=202257 RepID=A0A8J5ZI38_GALPY|nr:Membrane progestin receptor gamma [Galemys pyrenaicus]
MRVISCPFLSLLQVFHEQGILFGYRHPQSSATACLLSLFQMTNETLNIWTHLLPSWFFMWRFVTALYVTDVWNDSYSWPLLVYMGTSCVYPFASSCAHTFSSMSKNARHICYFLDYGAVNLFSLGSAIAYSAYAFPEALVSSAFHDYYLSLAVLNTIVSSGLSCYSRFLEVQNPRLCKVLRVMAFAYPYIWDSFPIFCRLFVLPGENAQSEAASYHQKHMAMTLLACFFYSAHLPECLAPGCFDYIGECVPGLPQAHRDLSARCLLLRHSGRSCLSPGHAAAKGAEQGTAAAQDAFQAPAKLSVAASALLIVCVLAAGHSHQLFHVCVIMATHMQMEAILLDKTLRKEWLLATSRPLSFSQISGAVLLCVIFSLSNIIYFSAALYRIPEPELPKKER